MAPLVRRSWSPRGVTPVLFHRTRHHRKVSMIAALCVSPNRTRVRLCFRLYPDRNITGSEVRYFLRHLLRHLHRPIVLIWDRLLAHRSVLVRRWIAAHPRLQPALLPPYAPELNPVETLFAYLKTNPLANLACLQLDDLRRRAHQHSRRLQHRPDLLRAFVQHGVLPLRLG